MNIVIRPATIADAAALAEIAARTFNETFANDNDPADMALHSERAYGVKQQTKEIENPAIATLLAECDGVLAGFTQLRNGSQPPPLPDAPSPVEIARFYVDRQWHGRGVAQRLMAAAEEEAKRWNARTLWLGVWERNPRAKAFYAKCGFVDIGMQTFLLGNDLQSDRVMMREL
ncbi:MAG TPA: GNAT family N-acetyltransferase [Thermoanaerobaculia bacterium]|nr:GNAT family N-acetyltransferase [Thermoanaerobaculia bacterium]